MPISIASLRERLRRAGRGERELWLLAAAGGFGLLILPFLIYVAGTQTLGVYEGGGLAAFLLDFLKGLVRPHLAYWLVVLGPYLLILLARLLWALRGWLRATLEAKANAATQSPVSGRKS